MKQHTYCTRINDETWIDIQRIKQLDGRSVNSLINEGLRMVRDAKMQELARNRKTRNSLASATSW